MPAANWDGTGIRWCDETWNPVHGCSKTSEGCKNCYAERVSRRFNHSPEPWTAEHAEQNVNVKRQKLADLDTLPDPCWVFVNSMSDLFHELVPPAFVGDTLGKICEHPESAFLILTKHGADTDRSVPFMPRNVLLGVSVESPRRTYRIDWLREQDAATKFISFEPLVECIPGTDLDLTGIDWAIIGGESGGMHPDDKDHLDPETRQETQFRRPMDPAWARNLVRACWRQDVNVFFKQHSGPKPESDIELGLQDGKGKRRIEEFPTLPRGVAPAPREFREVDDD